MRQRQDRCRGARSGRRPATRTRTRASTSASALLLLPPTLAEAALPAASCERSSWFAEILRRSVYSSSVAVQRWRDPAASARSASTTCMPLPSPDDARRRCERWSEAAAAAAAESAEQKRCRPWQPSSPLASLAQSSDAPASLAAATPTTRKTGASA